MQIVVHVWSLRLQDKVTSVPGEGVLDFQEAVDFLVDRFRVGGDPDLVEEVAFAPQADGGALVGGKLFVQGGPAPVVALLVETALDGSQ